jgi:hypothetical protein
MDEVRRHEDGELCGFVDERGGRWLALTLFRGSLGRHARRDDARAQVLRDGLAALAERWTLRHRDGDEEIVCIVEATPTEVTVARGFYALPGVPTLTIRADQFVTGEWEMRR